MPDHRGGGAEADLGHLVLALLRPVRRLAHREQPLDDVGDEEARDEQEQRGGHSVDLVAGAVQRFREQVEADHPEHQAPGESEHQVAPVGDVVGGPAADECHHERAKGDEDGHGPLLADRHRPRTPGTG